MSTISRMLLLASGVSLCTAAGASAAEYRCQKLDSSLRIAIEVAKVGHTLPCEVTVEDDRGERAVLYSAQYDRDYCPSRIEKTRADLEAEGWSCAQTSVENVVRRQPAAEETGAPAQASLDEDAGSGSGGALVTDDGRTIISSRQCRLGDQLRRIRIEAESPTSGTPCELIYWADGDQTRPGQMLWRAEHDASFCPRRLNIIVDKWIGEGWRCDPEEQQSAALEPPAAGEAEPAAAAVEPIAAETAPAGGESDALDADPALQAIVTADAERIGEWMQVEPAIEIAARGDLNDDGSDDAVVFLAYQSDQAAYRQYLMSYLLADDGYELASVKLLTGVSTPPARARVEAIDKGVIWLSQPDDDGAAPVQTGYRLEDQQLVEIDEIKRPENPAD